MSRSLEPRAITALAVTATSLFLLLTFTLYGPADAAIVSEVERGFAVEIASWFVDLLGAGAYVLVLVPLIWGVHVYFKDHTPDLHTRAVGTLVLAASTSALIGVLHLGETSFFAGWVGSAYGEWVAWLGATFGTGLGHTLGWALAVFFFLYSLVLATDWIFHSVRRGETGPTLAIAAAIETEPSTYELLGENDDAAPRTFISVSSAPALAEPAIESEEELVFDEPEAPVATVPEGWSTRDDGERTVLQAPSGYRGVEFQIPTDELAEPEPLYREPEELEDHLVLGADSPVFEDDVLFGETVTQESSEEPTEEIDLGTNDGWTDEETTPEESEAAAPAETETRAPATIGFPEPTFFDDEVISVDTIFSHVAGVDLGSDGPTDGASAVSELTDTFAPPAPPEIVAEAVAVPAQGTPETNAPEEPRSTFVDDLFFTPLPEFLAHDTVGEETHEPEMDGVVDPATESAPAEPVPAPESVPDLGDRGIAPLASTLGELGLDPLFRDSIDAILARGRASAVILQSHLGIGYGRANRILDQMTEVGLTGPEEPTGARELQLSEEALREFLEATAD